MLFQVVFGSGVVNFLIWLLLFFASTAMVAYAIRVYWDLRKRNFINPALLSEVSKSCAQKDLDEAYTLCSQTGKSLFAQTMNEVFRNFTLGTSGREQAAESAITLCNQALQRRINSLALCGNIAPMLGLLGTVTGMVDAFMGLGTALGPEKASILAIAISQALYTTAAGLLVAVPAITVSVIARNRLEERIGEVTLQVNELLNSFGE